MAKRKGRGSRGQRVNNYNASRPVTIRLTDPAIRPLSLLQQIEDRRTYHPDPYRPAALDYSPRHRLEVDSNTNNKQTSASAVPGGVQFQDAKHVMVCVRRKTRKEVMFALNRTGKGSGRGRRKRSMYSDVGC